MRAALLVALAATALALPAQAQLPAHTVTLEVLGLPAAVETNGTLAAIPFDVRVDIDGPACLALVGANSYEVQVRATVTNSTGAFTEAIVSPGIITVSGPALVATGSASRTESLTLVVNPGPYEGDSLEANVTVTASFAGGSAGCAGENPSAAAEATGALAMRFEPAAGFGEAQPGEEMPGPAVGLVAVALVAAALTARRQR